MTSGIDHLIINSPFAEPALHWGYDRERRRFVRRQGRRPAGFVRATPVVDSGHARDVPGIVAEHLANRPAGA